MRKRRRLDGEQRRSLIEMAVLGGLMVCCIALGGASRAGFVANAMVQILSVLVVAWAIVQRGPRLLSADERRLWALGFALVALFVVQLVPLPYALWRALPGHGAIAAGLRAAGLGAPWLPASLAPDYTLRALLGVLPAIAFVMILARTRRMAADAVVGAVVAMALLSALIGMLQVGSGRAAATFFYAVTNRGNAVGFFANANHLATLMVVSIPLAAGLLTALLARRKSSRRTPFALLLLVPVVVMVSVALLMTESTAGLGLLALALAGSVPIMFADFFRKRRWLIVAGMVLAGVLAIGIVAGVALLDHGNVDGMARPYMWRTTLAAIQGFMPVGSGFGSFEQVFHLFEDRRAITPTFANHAHNDLLEFTLEAGVPGLILLGLFLWWFGRSAWAIWLDGTRRDPLAQGASLAIVIVLLHSLVDYPLRTGAMAAIFGLCCALVARPARSAVQPIVAPEAPPTARHLSA